MRGQGVERSRRSARSHHRRLRLHCEEATRLSAAARCLTTAAKIKSFGGGEDIFQNFIAAVRSRRQEDLDADIYEGHRSTTVTHLGNISTVWASPPPRRRCAADCRSARSSRRCSIG